jgi:hypothetical protein
LERGSAAGNASAFRSEYSVSGETQRCTRLSAHCKITAALPPDIFLRLQQLFCHRLAAASRSTLA